jgi:hypothetical protein
VVPLHLLGIHQKSGMRSNLLSTCAPVFLGGLVVFFFTSAVSRFQSCGDISTHQIGIQETPTHDDDDQHSIAHLQQRVHFLEWKLGLRNARTFPGVSGPMDSKCLQPYDLWQFGLGRKPDAAAGSSYPSQTGSDIYNMLRFDGTQPIWTQGMWSWYFTRLEANLSISVPDYPHSTEDLFLAYSKFPDAIKSRCVAVFSSITPWAEATLHRFGAAQIYTVDYNTPIIEPTIPVQSLTFSSIRGSQHVIQFDSAVSFSGIEHDGNGRYGDPMNPEGDLSALRELWCLLRPHGILFLGVPIDSSDRNTFPYHRIYGPIRLPQLFEPFTLLGHIWDGQFHPALKGGVLDPKFYERPGDIQDWQYQPVFVLQKRPDFRL